MFVTITVPGEINTFCHTFYPDDPDFPGDPKSRRQIMLALYQQKGGKMPFIPSAQAYLEDTKAQTTYFNAKWDAATNEQINQV